MIHSIHTNLNTPRWESSETTRDLKSDISSLVGEQIERIEYFMQFVDPSRKDPSKIGMISWKSLREGLQEIQLKLEAEINNNHLSPSDLSLARDGLAKIAAALNKISE